MNDLPQNWEELIEEISKKRRSERDKNKIKEMNDFMKLFREMRSNEKSLKRKKFIDKILLNI
jgi:hypothetical protein